MCHSFYCECVCVGGGGGGGAREEEWGEVYHQMNDKLLGICSTKI